MADPAPARPRRRGLGTGVLRPVQGGVRRRDLDRARGPGLRSHRRADQARLPAGARRAAAVREVTAPAGRGFVRTVLGDVEPDALGVTYAHEHLIVDSP